MLEKYFYNITELDLQVRIILKRRTVKIKMLIDLHFSSMSARASGTASFHF